MDKLFYLKLLNLEGTGRKTILKLLDLIENKSLSIRKLTNEDIIELFNILKGRYKRIKMPSIDRLKVAEEKSLEIYNESIKNNIKIISIGDQEYPKEFARIDVPPIIYYSKGNHNIVNSKKKVAIIGTRYPTIRGKRYAYKIGGYFGKRDYKVVSGLAIGCDTYGHLGCIDDGGQTIAVLPSDLLNIYPGKNTSIAEKIIEKNGCLISEYPIGTKIMDYHFIERDRLQAALSKVVIVIETGIKSGTMHTVSYTNKYGKTLACLEYPKEFENYPSIQGNNILIQKKSVLRVKNQSDLGIVEKYYKE